RLGVGGRRRRQARRPRPLAERDRGSPDEERALLRAGGRRARRPGAGARARARARPRPARRRAPARAARRGDAAGREARRRQRDRRRAGRARRTPPVTPLAGRRIWFAGIGGAGMSALAIVARAWGADVAGWDRARTPYLTPLAGVDVSISPEPPPAPPGFEVVVSSAFVHLVAGRRRGELLAELVALRPSIVVAGAHGKTTTASMIAFCLARLGLDPAFLIGGAVPQLGGNAGAGAGWLVAEGDESDRPLALLRPQIAVLTNVDLDHHSEFATRGAVEELFERWLSDVPHVVRGERLEPVALRLAVPGDHNRRNAAAALAALDAAGVPRSESARAIADFRGVGRRFELRGEVGGVRVVDDYG